MARFSPTALLLAILLTGPVLLGAGTAAAQVNQAPVIVAPPEIQRDPGQLMLFNVSTSDPDGDSVSLAATGVPAGATFRTDGNGNGSFFWTATNADEGFYTLTLIATDDGTPVASSSADVLITIGDPNMPPELAPIGDQMATVGQMLVIMLSATDADGDPLTFSTDPTLTGSSLRDDGMGNATFEYTPSAADVGNLVLTFEVSDGVDIDFETIVITIGDVNAPPLLDPIGDRQIVLGETVDIALMASDADGDGLVFDATGLPEGVELTDRGDGTGQLLGEPVDAGLFTITVTVSDDGTPSEAASETFDLDVQEPPDEPSLLLDAAQWMRGRLEVAGHGGMPGEAVEIRDAATGGSLGQLIAGKDGSFAGALRPFVAPCSVKAQAGDVATEAMPVADAPASCGEAPPTRVLLALWNCHRGLYVVGHRAPPGATVRIYDADSGALLAETEASRWGFFMLHSFVSEHPETIQAGVEVDGVEWLLEPTRVYEKGRCHDHRHRHGWNSSKH